MFIMGKKQGESVLAIVSSLSVLLSFLFSQALWNDIVLENWEGLFNFATKRKNIWKELR